LGKGCTPIARPSPHLKSARLHGLFGTGGPPVRAGNLLQRSHTACRTANTAAAFAERQNAVKLLLPRQLGPRQIGAEAWEHPICCACGGAAFSAAVVSRALDSDFDAFVAQSTELIICSAAGHSILAARSPAWAAGDVPAGGPPTTHTTTRAPSAAGPAADGRPSFIAPFPDPRCMKLNAKHAAGANGSQMQGDTAQLTFAVHMWPFRNSMHAGARTAASCFAACSSTHDCQDGLTCNRKQVETEAPNWLQACRPSKKAPN